MRARLARGLPLVVVGCVACLALIALVAISALRSETSPAYAHLRATDGGCFLDPERSRNAVSCRRVGPGQYLISFSERLDGRVAVATRSTCCPGAVSAELDGDRGVVVALPRRTVYPVVLSVAVP